MASNMLPDEMKALVRRRFEALDEGKFGILDEIFQPSYQLNVPGIPGRCHWTRPGACTR
jgi:hypothetical protein